ncbi:Gfo/Idh/MocA family protein [Enorma burkinafasonensis]|uniref:Gfo/Idh/MocA family protein n=1 Tax=Enorma burkinafasonensis TaxID=2590867 RepID=UPI0016439E1F|nr:Gfo/Idh/MocA family oxidoreductase [Enorma burkinafasonensis]
MIRWGILGAGNIAHRFAASLAHVEGAELVAASCRSEGKAHAFLDAVPCAEGANAYGDHAALLADPDVDAVYLATPHAFHRAWALATIEAGKAVLCEKPAMLTAEEAREVTAAAHDAGVLFMEAMKTRFVPLHDTVVRHVGELGRIERVEASLCNDSLGHYIGTDVYVLGGGAGSGVLLDCGIYCASWLEELLPGSIGVTGAACTRYEDGSDVYCDGELTIGGVSAELECACDRAKPRELRVTGTNGTLVVEDLHRPQRARLVAADGSEHAIEMPYEVDDFYGQIAHFCGLMRAGATESPVMPHAATVRCAQILDAVSGAMD